MVQKSSRRRGRPPEFDREAVVRAAMHAYWRRGVDHVTVADLEQATGVSRTTLYNSFGGKDGVFAAAAAAYVATLDGVLLAPLRDGTGGLDDVQQFLATLRSLQVDPAWPDGCMIVNDMGSPSHDPTATVRYLDGLRTALAAALRRAAAAGEVAATAVGPMADALRASVVGCNQQGRRGGPAAAAAAIDGTIALLAAVDAGRSSP